MLQMAHQSDDVADLHLETEEIPIIETDFGITMAIADPSVVIPPRATHSVGASWNPSRVMVPDVPTLLRNVFHVT